MYETCKREVDTDPSVAAMLYTEYGDNIHTHNKKRVVKWVTLCCIVGIEWR